MKIRVAVVGYGNVGKKVLEALEAAPDFKILGVVRRGGAKAQAAGGPPELAGYRVVKNIEAFGNLAVDVAIICSPSRMVEKIAKPMLKLGICTVDGFDIHSEIVGVRRRLDKIAKDYGSVAIVGAGWDPGSDSVVRALMDVCAPAGKTFTNFGPGMSMGHTVAAKAVPGVAAALSMTLPVGEGRHEREVFVELADGASMAEVEAAIKADPYFADDKTTVRQVDDVASMVDVAHGVRIERQGTSGRTDGQRFEYAMRIDNPALTAQIMVSCARAAVRLCERAHDVEGTTVAAGYGANPDAEYFFGARTMIELAPIDLLPGTPEENIKRLV